jgi:hypothetical protein
MTGKLETETRLSLHSGDCGTVATLDCFPLSIVNSPRQSDLPAHERGENFALSATFSSGCQILGSLAVLILSRECYFSALGQHPNSRDRRCSSQETRDQPTITEGKSTAAHAKLTLDRSTP